VIGHSGFVRYSVTRTVRVSYSTLVACTVFIWYGPSGTHTCTYNGPARGLCTRIMVPLVDSVVLSYLGIYVLTRYELRITGVLAVIALTVLQVLKMTQSFPRSLLRYPSLG
jgi:hypothetical protein